MTDAAARPGLFTPEDCVALARAVATRDDTANILGLALRIHEATARPPAMTQRQLARFADTLTGRTGVAV
jgi:hypothetical protein